MPGAAFSNQRSSPDATTVNSLMRFPKGEPIRE
jgi:hypothetical protein